jgi:Skp family chaperone for outer membrane proteins
MKPIALAFITLFLVLVTGTPALAAAAEDPVGAVALEELVTRLELTAEQQARIAPLLQQRNDRLRALATDLDADSPRRQKLKTLREARSIQQEFVSKVSPLLTSGQQAEWEALREEMREKLKERRQASQ